MPFVQLVEGENMNSTVKYGFRDRREVENQLALAAGFNSLQARKLNENEKA